MYPLVVFVFFFSFSILMQCYWFSDFGACERIYSLPDIILDKFCFQYMFDSFSFIWILEPGSTWFPGSRVFTIFFSWYMENDKCFHLYVLKVSLMPLLKYSPLDMISFRFLSLFRSHCQAPKVIYWINVLRSRQDNVTRWIELPGRIKSRIVLSLIFLGN